MNMASKGILIIFSIICISTGNAQAAFNVDCKPETVGQYGQPSLLECIAKTPLNDAKIRVVTWKKDGAPLLVFNKGKTDPQPGYSFAEPSWNVMNMNVSLLIANTALEHQGVYECMVMSDRGDDTNQTSFKVTAKYNKPTIRSSPEKITLSGNGTLTCDSEGGYPKGELRWFDEDNKTKSSRTEARPTASGLFHLTSRLTLERGSVGSKYTCRVVNASGGKEDEEQILIQDTPAGQGQEKEVDPYTRIVAPVVVIGSLITGLLLVLLLVYRCRSQHPLYRQLSTISITGHHRGVPSYDADVEEGDPLEMDKP